MENMASSNTTASATTGATLRRGHVAVCPFPFASHPTILLLLGHKIAASALHVQVSMFTTESSAAVLSASLSPEEDHVQIFSVDDGMPESKRALQPLEKIRCFMEAAGENIRKSMAAAEDAVGVKISCVVADAFLSDVCRQIAEEKKVKWVALWPSSAAALAAHMHTDELRSRIGAEGMEAHKDETVDKYIPGFPPIPISDLPPDVLAMDVSSVSPIPRILRLMSLRLPKAAAIAMNSFDHLDSTVTTALNAAFLNKFLSVGPHSLTMSPPTLEAQDEHGCLPWLDTHLTAPTTVLYISLGTSQSPPPEEITTLAEALEDTRVPFLWSLPPRFTVCLPEGFVERTTKCGKGKVVPWAPQLPVLRHVAIGAQLTHCGWNSVLESIVTGVPMICRPFEIAEHVFNKSLVESVWEIGVAVEGGKLARSATARAVERVLLTEEGRRIREKIREMKKHAQEAVSEPDGRSAKNMNKFISIITG